LQNVEIRDRLLAYRVARGWTQARTAEEASISPTTIAHIETGANINPRRATLMRLAMAFGVSLDEFLSAGSPKAPAAQRPAWVLDMRLEQARRSLEDFNADRLREAEMGVVRVRRNDDPRARLQEVRLDDDPTLRHAWLRDVLAAKRANVRELAGLGVLAWRDDLLARGTGGAEEDPEAKRMYEEAVRLDHALAEMWGFLLEEEEHLAETARAGVEEEYRRRVVKPVQLPEDDGRSRAAG
jgi:transcriptional regulator with XRE-family HTH domain